MRPERISGLLEGSLQQTNDGCAAFLRGGQSGMTSTDPISLPKKLTTRVRESHLHRLQTDFLFIPKILMALSASGRGNHLYCFQKLIALLILILLLLLLVCSIALFTELFHGQHSLLEKSIKISIRTIIPTRLSTAHCQNPNEQGKRLP